MLRLGTAVRLNGRDGMVVARTLTKDPYYDVRLDDGTVVKYVKEADLEPTGSGGLRANGR